MTRSYINVSHKAPSAESQVTGSERHGQSTIWSELHRLSQEAPLSIYRADENNQPADPNLISKISRVTNRSNQPSLHRATINAY